MLPAEFLDDPSIYRRANDVDLFSGQTDEQDVSHDDGAACCQQSMMKAEGALLDVTPRERTRM